jgi:hypothetical protein
MPPRRGWRIFGLGFYKDAAPTVLGNFQPRGFGLGQFTKHFSGKINHQDAKARRKTFNTKRCSICQMNKKIILCSIGFAFLGYVLVVVIPNFVRMRYESSVNACIVNLRQIQSAKDQWKLENNKKDGDVVTEADLKPYLLNGNFPKCPAGGTYIIGRIGDDPKCSIGTSNWPNNHVLPEDNNENWWTNFKEAYSILFGLRHAQKP